MLLEEHPEVAEVEVLADTTGVHEDAGSHARLVPQQRQHQDERYEPGCYSQCGCAVVEGDGRLQRDATGRGAQPARATIPTPRLSAGISTKTESPHGAAAYAIARPSRVYPTSVASWRCR